ncbi:MAG: PHP domain-containing protein [Ruminococcaceae bacterium]|nr:PHP domain-containing protein [Oscillospiraceae bacterium]
MQRIIAPVGTTEKLKKMGELPKEKVWILPENGNLYKVNMHSHSTISDGNFTPEELKEIYVAQGYHAVAFTDHRKCVPHTRLTDEKFVALTGTELDFSYIDENGYVRKTVHINAIAKNPDTEFEKKSMPLDYDLINQTVQEMKDMDCIVMVNHPVFSDMSTEDVLRIKGMDGVEVFNSIDTMFNNYSDESAFYEYFLRAGGKAAPIAGDDCHMRFEDGSPFTEYFQGFTVIKAPELTYDALIQGITDCALYASTGPEFQNIWLEGNMLHVQCSPVCGVYVHGKYLSYKAVEIERTDCLTDVTLDISGLRASSPYIWVQLRDTNGKKAWAMPYWF